MNWKKKGKVLSAALLAVALGACDILTVNDPGRFTGPDLDGALQAVADGVEGRSHSYAATFVTYMALMADEYQHTGTWGGYDNMDHGAIQYGWYGWLSDAQTNRRVFAQQSMERFKRVLGEAEAASSSIMAQVALAEGTYTLLSVHANCEAVLRPARTGDEGEPSPMYREPEVRMHAAGQFSNAVNVAQAAGAPQYGNAARAGKAIALYLAGDYPGAVAEASQVPDGYSYDAIFNQTFWNSVVTLTTKGNNEAAGLMYWLWPRIDKTEEAHSYVRDWATNEYDMRMPVWFDGEIATDNETPHYSQYKYTSRQSPIPMFHADHMRLIEAEAMAMSGDFAGATGVLNGLRAAVGLAPVDVPDSPEAMVETLLHERFAELFMEGYRNEDLYRMNLTRERFESFNDPERPGVGRPMKFSGSTSEAQFNPDVEDNESARCFPIA